MGTGVTTLAAFLDSRRGGGLLDDAERLAPADLETWVRDHPRGILGSHRDPAQIHGPVAARCVPFRLQPLGEDPDSVARCLAAMAAEAGIPEALPPALAALPCPGNLLGLRNRLVRWRLLGQLPDPPEGSAGTPALPLASEDLAANLHVLERVLLHRALRRSYGNRVEAAKRLGVSRRQLYLLIGRHGDPVRGEPPSNAGPKRLNRSHAQSCAIFQDRPE
jgi:hypothetical protein